MSAIVPNLPSGGCFALDQLPEFLTWRSSEEFTFFAAVDPVAGCEPTVLHPSDGLYWNNVQDGTYEIVVGRQWLPTCGRVQFDAQAYTAAGGLAPGTLQSLVFDSGRDCSELLGTAVQVERPPSTHVPDATHALSMLVLAVLTVRALHFIAERE